MAQRSLARILWYETLRILCFLAAVVWLRLRWSGRDQVPRTGALLILSNHQSHLDPVLIGIACPRVLSFLARDSLFRFRPFAWWISGLGAIPIDRDGTGLTGLKQTLRRLKDEEAVLIFPEGTRTFSGDVAPLKPGFSMLARRGTVTLLPMAIDGAHRAWPRTRGFPLPAPVQVEFGAPIAASELDGLSEAELVALVERRIRECHARARARRLSASPPGLRMA
ncbi:MAG: 1-acyl-sn-glycerol-3-phosphate acyltransferase [Pirellulales bacterium]|nr:1-acyl-sn-glycerol-3-phosphate acyltransferase [Pirellulales bacterium]